MIPKVIHYCWFGGKPLPLDVEQCIRSWKKFCPDYEIRQWNESNYDVGKHPFMKAAYETGSWAFVSDYARLDIIYNHGGVYLVTDVELLKDLQPLLELDCYFGMQQDRNLIATGLGFGAVKGHGAVKKMLEYYDNLTFSTERKVQLACPQLNSAALEACGFVREDKLQVVEGAHIFPCTYFDPLSPGRTRDLTGKDTVSIHHYSASWTSGKQRLKRKLIRLIGEKRIHKIKKLLGK